LKKKFQVRESAPHVKRVAVLRDATTPQGIGLFAVIRGHCLGARPRTAPHVRGVEGRYFVIALPMAAIFIASMANSDLPRDVVAATAITGSLLSGVASFQALLGAHWSVP